MIVSGLTGALLSVKAELGESDQHVWMGPHPPDPHCCRDGSHVGGGGGGGLNKNLCVEKCSKHACTPPQ